MIYQKKWALTASFIIIQNFFLALYFYSLQNYQLHIVLTAEDHLGEWSQFIFYAIACCSLCSYTFTYFRSWERLERIILALALFILAGEEISWGQRIFHFSIKAVEALNNQGEINAHNLFPLYGNVGIYIIWCLLFILIIPLCGLIFSKIVKRKKGNTFQSIFFNFGFIFIHFELIILYLFLPREKHIYFYEFSELMISFSFCHLVLKDYWQSKTEYNLYSIKNKF